MTEINAINVARHVLGLEAKAIKALSETLSSDFCDAVNLVKGLKGRAILAGVGKSGHVARKIAATMASTGTNALFIHPTEASHGDIVIAALDGDFTVKELCLHPEPCLKPHNKDYKTIPLSDDTQLDVFGVVTYAIHKTYRK